jgi:hypothetical protein
MDWGQIISVYSRLVLGAAAAFLAIMLWSRTRSAAWMLIVAGTITAYVEIIYSVVELLGFTAISGLVIGSVPLAAILLPALRMIFFIAAFLIMIIRRKT